MYVSMTDMLERASAGHYGVMAINCFNLESAYATIHAAEKANAPIIIDPVSYTHLTLPTNSRV